jgi:hypothetical protein
MFLQQLGRLTEAERLRMPGAMPAPEPNSFITRDSPYGELRVPAPLVSYSRTPARWDRPASPPGQDALAWVG